MSQNQGHQKSSLVNGVNRRRGDHDLGNGTQSNRTFRSPPSNPMGVGQLGHHVNNHINANAAQISLSKNMVESKEADQGGFVNEHLMHLTACLIGQPVEVQVKCGAMYAGIFHTGNAGKDHGIVLKMARLIKEGSSKGKHELSKDLAVRPQKKYIIYAKDFVQIIAKDVPLRGETMQNGRVRENRVEIITDSLLSQSRHGEVQRELEPWTPDTDVPKELGLDSTFDNTWHRNWNQFEINRTLFGVKSTFDEELYTTKLEKGPQMREREREALRIAREIEGETTKNLHLGEERGLQLTKEFELLDEESRFSSVLRTHEDVGEDYEDVNIDVHNENTFGSSVTQASCNSAKPCHNSRTSSEAQSGGGSQPPLADSQKEAVPASANVHIGAEERPLQVLVGDWSKHSLRVGGFPSPRPSSTTGDTTNLKALDLDPGSPHVTKDVYRDFNEFKQQENARRGRQHREDQVNELKSFSKSLQELAMTRQHTSSAAAPKTAGACAPPASAVPLPTSITNSSTPAGLNDGAVPVIPSSKTATEEARRSMSNEGGGSCPLERPSTSGACSTPLSSANSASPPQVPSSPSESSASASFTKKSALNPQAKEFKLNPNAKSFTPNYSPLRPPSPVVQGSTYASGALQPGSPMQNMAMGAAGNPVPLQPAGQSTTKYTPYTNVAVAGASSGTSYFASPATYTTSAPMLPATGKAAAKASPPQLHQQALFGGPQPVRYAPQAPVLQAVPTYLHHGGHLYPQQMMFGQPGQVVYFQPFPQGPMPPPPPPTASGAPQQMQTNLQGSGMQEMQGCVAPPYIAAGQQHFLPQLPNPMQPTPSVLAPPTLTTIQPPQSVAGPMAAPQTASVSGANSGTSMIRLGGIVGANT